MYRNPKFNKNAKATTAQTTNKRKALALIDEDTTIKLSRNNNDKVESASNLAENETGFEIFDSEENIPASQEPTARYLSQRSIAASLVRTLPRNASRSQKSPSSYFELVLVKCGVQWDDVDTFVLSCDHIAFVSNFRKMLVKSINYPDNLQSFKNGLRNAFATQSNLLQKLISGCTIEIDECGKSYQSQESMIVNFLYIDILRNDVLELLLEKIEQVAAERNEQIVNNVSLLPLLLSQLRYITQSHGDQIFECIKRIFENCQEWARWEIIDNAGLILHSSKHDTFAQLLLDNLTNSKDVFNHITLKSLGNLNLGITMQDELRCKALSYIRDGQCSIAILPTLVKFLLKFLNENSDNCIVELINILREILLYRGSSKEQEQEHRKIQLELFKLINQSLKRSKKLYINWQRLISNLATGHFRSIDLIVLLLLVDIKEENTLYIENILRKRIKQEDISVDILKETEAQFGIVLEKHANILTQLLQDFLKERNQVVADFARSAYSILFKLCVNLQKNILLKLLQLTCDPSSNMTNVSLELIRDIQRSYPNEIQNWGTLLMALLDRLSEISLSQTRLVMQILCSVAFPPPDLRSCPIMQDQIDMTVKKQIISRLPLIRKQGIIGLVQLVDCIARIEKISEAKPIDLDVVYDTVDELPEGRGKTAANLIMCIHSSTNHCAESLALFYDELASIFIASPADRFDQMHLDKHFLIWFCDLMIYYFQNSFATEKEPNEMLGGIELTYQKCINNEADNSNLDESILSLALNLSELVLKPKADCSILLMTPVLNLLRVLTSQRYDGSLEQINALLGCAIVLPTFFDKPNVDSIFNDYDVQQQKSILDIYFHCANWFRETINCFVTQCDRTTRAKVLIRLAELIKVEDHIRKLLPRAPDDYEPPLCQFFSIAQAKTVKSKGFAAAGKSAKSNAPKCNKKCNTKAVANETNLHNNSSSTVDAHRLNNKSQSKHVNTSNSKINFNNLYAFQKERYRQMDSSIMLLLGEKLHLDYTTPAEQSEACIALTELRFILHDLVMKLESITGVQKFQTEQSLQFILKPYYFIFDLSRFLPAIVQNMEMIMQRINQQLEAANHNYNNADLFSNHFSYLKVCAGLCLRLLAAYFSWSEFALEKRTDLLKDSLLAILLAAENEMPDLRKKPIASLAKRAFAKCLTYENNILELQTAIYQHQLINTLKRFYMAHNEDGNSLVKMNKEIHILCKTLLSRKWFNYEGVLEKGANCNTFINELLKTFLSDADFKRQHDIASILIDDLRYLNGKNGCLKSFPNITKANFPLLFRCLCEILIQKVNVFITTQLLSNDKLKKWEISCNQLSLLREILVNSNMPRNYPFYMKYCNIYVKLLIQHGMQLLENELSRSPERVEQFFKNLQGNTRFLHNLCCHSKAVNNISIVSQIPVVRETIERLVFRVKALCVANKCADAFWMGNLKNRDLQGDEILSESSQSEVDNSDEELPDDDDSVDDTHVDTDQSSRNCASVAKVLSRSECI